MFYTLSTSAVISGRTVLGCVLTLPYVTVIQFWGVYLPCHMWQLYNFGVCTYLATCHKYIKLKDVYIPWHTSVCFWVCTHLDTHHIVFECVLILTCHRHTVCGCVLTMPHVTDRQFMGVYLPCHTSQTMRHTVWGWVLTLTLASYISLACWSSLPDSRYAFNRYS